MSKTKTLEKYEAIFQKISQAETAGDHRMIKIWKDVLNCLINRDKKDKDERRKS